MKHLVRNHDLVVEPYFSIIEVYVARQLEDDDPMVDSRLCSLVSELYISAYEAARTLRYYRNRQLDDFVGHGSQILKLRPIELVAFVKLCGETKRLSRLASQMLDKATPDELVFQNPYSDSQRDLPCAADILEFLLVVRPATLLAQLVNWWPIADSCRSVLHARWQNGFPGAFLIRYVLPA